jgi:hypothetical protein
MPHKCSAPQLFEAAIIDANSVNQKAACEHEAQSLVEWNTVDIHANLQRKTLLG